MIKMRLNRFFVIALTSLIVTSVSFATELKERSIKDLLIEDPGELYDQEMRRVLVPMGIARVKDRSGQWRMIKKQLPASMDGWSHWNHGTERNPVSRDKLVGPPRWTQWIDSPSWSKKHWCSRLSAIVTSGGRLYYVQDDTPT